MIELERTGPPTTERDVANFEATLPAPLPDDYRAFLLSSNGGRPEENWWPPEVSAADFGVHVFYSLGDVPTPASLVVARETFQSRMPGSLLTIGSDSFGNQICLALQEDRGHVWFFDHDRETDPEDGVDPGLLTILCASFTELLNTLEPEPELEEMRSRSAQGSV